MKCPTCTDSTLVMADRSGIEIDYCPTCRGVWLDRGELDKIIERNAAATAPAPQPTSSPDRQPAPRVERRDDDDDDDDRRRDRDRDNDRDRNSDSAYPKKKKRSSFLGDIFEF